MEMATTVTNAVITDDTNDNANTNTRAIHTASEKVEAAAAAATTTTGGHGDTFERRLEKIRHQHQRQDNNRDQDLCSVLGLRSLSIVLSYLEECEGTSFLLSQQKYWTDRILPLLRVQATAPTKQKSKANESSGQLEQQEKAQKNQNQKYRHRFFLGRDHKPVTRIPDASTRLDRLNTRRWNIRRKQQQQLYGAERESNPNLTTNQLAEIEWEESLGSVELLETKHRCQSRRRLRSIMNPPLLRFYDGEKNKNTRSKEDTTTPLAQSTPKGCFKDGTTCLASYPRSGNTLLRSLLETVTGFVTASDTRPDRPLSVALAERPPFFVGEGLAPTKKSTTSTKTPQGGATPSSPFFTPITNSNTVGSDERGGGFLPQPPICKTHWPERIGCHEYECQRVVLLVRNPFDAADSYWHMNLTNTHTEKVTQEVTEKYLGFYQALVRHEILQVWISFLDYYWKECTKRKVPLLIVRYEDLVLRQRDELRRILRFSCCNDDDDNNHEDWWKNRLEAVTKDAAGSDGDENNDDPSSSPEKRKSGRDHRQGSYKFGYRSSGSASDDPTIESDGSPAEESPLSSSATIKTSNQTSSSGHGKKTILRSSHPSIGRSLRNGMFPKDLLRAIHDFDDRHFGHLRPKDHQTGKWLERLGYHVYKQGFPNNLNRLPPVPVLELEDDDETRGTGRLAMNTGDVSLELRPRNSPYGRNLRQWRRERTAKDTKPFPTIK